MKKLIFFCFLLFLVIQSKAQTVCEAVASSNWNSSATWNCDSCNDGYPGSTSNNGQTACPDIVVIPEGINISIPNTTTIFFDGTLQIFGTLTFGSTNSRINMDSESTIQLAEGANITVVGGGTGSGNSTRVSIGDSELKGTEVEGMTGPNQYNEDNLEGGGCQSSGDCDGDPLPIKLKSFDARPSGTSIALAWTTLSEEDFSHFLIEHSTNGRDYFPIGQVEGHGSNTEFEISYDFTHEDAKAGLNYYRLKAVDLDGSHEYFGPASGRLQEQELAIRLFPNPSNGEAIHLEGSQEIEFPIKIQIYNRSGQLILEQDEDHASNGQSIHFTKSLPRGLYHITIRNRKGFSNHKLLVE